MSSQELEVGIPSDVGGVFAALSTVFAVRADAAEHVTYTYLDTVDWRLHRAGLALREARGPRCAQLVLDSIDADRVLAPSRRHTWPSRVDRLPASPVRDRISDPVGARALLPLAEVEAVCIPMRLLDVDEKTRVRVTVEQQRLVRPRKFPLPLRLIITPLRGYDRDADRCVRLLKEHLGATFEPGPAAAAAFAAAGRTPADQAGDAIVLDPADPISRSVAIALRWWLTVVVTNRDGVVADLDPEFLTELRSAVAASRALLDLVGDVLPGDTATRTADGFGWLATLTSRTHDLDRCLCEFGGEGQLDVHDLTDLEPLREHLARSRRVALARLRTELRSERVTALTSSWRAALDGVASADVLGPRTDSVAKARICRAFDDLLRDASGAATLRRSCTRMRYLLRSFACLYDDQIVPAVAQQLTTLQASLDDVHDCRAQRAEITATAQRLRTAGPQALLAMGALRDRVDAQALRAAAGLARDLDSALSEADIVRSALSGDAR